MEKKIKLLNLSKKGELKIRYSLGHKSNIYDFMRNSTVFVLSSLWEEVGFVIVEAALCNSFVISSDCPNDQRIFR